MKIAVVGSGISGLSAAYYLSKKHHVDLFEKGDHFGGHAYTIDLNIDKNDKQIIPIDIGFIVFNHYTYPNLIEFFKQNKVEIEKSDMSFSVTTSSNEVEYCGKGLNGMFSSRKNLFNLKFLKMFLEIIKFYKRSSNLNLKDNKTGVVNLTLPEDGISPGQACVFYNKDQFGYKVLGGGWIKE